MRAFFFFVAILSIAAAVRVNAATHAPNVGLESGRLVGTWECVGSAPGNTAIETYSVGADGALQLDNDVRASTGAVGTVRETFAYDSMQRTWHLSAPPNRFFGGMSLSANAWTGSQWVFTGSEIVSDASRPVRIVYTLFGDGFHREHQRQQDGAWQDDGQYVCHRTAPIPAQATPIAQAPVSVLQPTPPPTLTPTPISTVTPAPVPALSAPEIPATPKSPASGPLPEGTLPATPTNAPSVSFTPVGSGIATPSKIEPIHRTPTPFTIVTETPKHKAVPPARPTGSPWTDRAFLLVGGVWSCLTETGEPAKHVYKRAADGTIVLHNEIVIAKKVFAIDESYRFDKSKDRWYTVTQGNAYMGIASPWLQTDWIFDGSVPHGTSRVPVRMVYGYIGVNAFEREFRRSANNHWKTFASEACRRH